MFSAFLNFCIYYSIITVAREIFEVEIIQREMMILWLYNFKTSGNVIKVFF